ncbi:MAG: LamG domain-containing protein [Patescibacteria group bacterium]
MSRYSELMAVQGATHYWELNDASNGALATIGNVNLNDSGTLIYQEPAVVGTGIRFTEPSSYLTSVSTSQVNFNNSQPFSYSFMFMVYSFATPQGLLSKRVAASSSTHFAAFIFTSNHLFFDLGSNQTRWDTGWTPDVNTWYHIAFTFNPADTNRYRLYVNGVMTATTQVFVPNSSGTNAPIFIGILGGSTSGIGRSTIDEFAIFTNKLLSAAEVAAQFGTAFPVTRVFNGTSWVDADKRII